jgi:hypothetical protein
VAEAVGRVTDVGGHLGRLELLALFVDGHIELVELQFGDDAQRVFE